MSTLQEMPVFPSIAIDVSQSSDPFIAGVCALTQLNVDTCRSAFTGAARQWESVLLAQTPEQFVRVQADVMTWLALQFAGYTRGWMDIVSETIRAGEVTRNHDDAHEPEAHAWELARAILARAAKADPHAAKRESPPPGPRSSTR